MTTSADQGRQEVVSLAVGEQATIVCDGAVAVCLRGGTIEIDGALMVPDQPYQFRTNVHRRITLYTLSGGTFVAMSKAPFSVHKAAATLPALGAVAKACARRDTNRVLIVGEPRAGKSVAAKTIMNTLLRAHSGDSDCRLVYLEGDYSTGSVACSGMMAAVECAPPALRIDAPFMETVPVPFFVGHVNPVNELAGVDLIQFAQCMACAESLLRRGEHRLRHLVIDAPPAPVEKEKWFVRQLLDLCQPTHVVALGSDEKFGWIRDEIARHPTAIALSLLAPTVPEALREATKEPKSGETSIAEYFCGQLSVRLQCAAVVAPVNALTFVRIERPTDDQPLRAVVVDPSQLSPGVVVAVSHAQVLEEVPFANVAGAMVVKDVCVAENEIAFYAPEADSIPRAFIIIGGPEMTCRPNLLAPFAV